MHFAGYFVAYFLLELDHSILDDVINWIFPCFCFFYIRFN